MFSGGSGVKSLHLVRRPFLFSIYSNCRMFTTLRTSSSAPCPRAETSSPVRRRKLVSPCTPSTRCRPLVEDCGWWPRPARPVWVSGWKKILSTWPPPPTRISPASSRTRLSWKCRGSQQLGEGGSIASSPAMCPGQCRQCSRCQDGFLAWKMWEAAAAVAVLAEVSSGTAGAAVTATIPTEKGHSFLEW